MSVDRELKWIGRSNPSRTVIVDRTVDRPVLCLGPVQRWAGSPFTRKWTVQTCPVQTHGPDRTGSWTVDRTGPPDRSFNVKIIIE
jgi:hypothetical protein